MFLCVCVCARVSVCERTHLCMHMRVCICVYVCVLMHKKLMGAMQKGLLSVCGRAGGIFAEVKKNLSTDGMP